MFQLPDQAAVQVHSAHQVCFADALVLRVSDSDRAGSQEQRLAPVRERGQVRGKREYVSLETVEFFHPERRRVANEFVLTPAFEQAPKRLAQLLGPVDGAKKDLRLRLVRNDVGGAPPGNHSEVDGGRPQQWIHRQRELAQVGEDVQQFLDSRLAEVRISRVSHFAPGADVQAQDAFCTQGQLV